MAKKSQVIKFKRAPQAPKRFKSAYMFYSAKEHRLIRTRTTNKKLRSSDIAKMISLSWRELPDHEKAEWQRQAQIDRERYEREKAAYNGPWKIPNKKDPRAPKKPMSAFLAFGNERRKSIAEANPSMNGTEISCLLSKLWRECAVDVKKAYRDREAHQRELFKIRRMEWERKKKEHGADSDTCSEGSRDSDDGQDYTTSVASTSEQVSSKNERYTFQSSKSLREDQHNLPNLVPRSNMDSGQAHLDCAKSSPLLLPSQKQISTTDPLPFEIFDTLYHPSDAEKYSSGRCVLPERTSQTSNCGRNGASRFNNYSMQDILEDDELFEDFSPADTVGNV